MIYLLFFLLFISIMILTILYLSVRVIAKNYQTKEGKKKVMNFTLKGMQVINIALIATSMWLIAYHEKDNSYINTMFWLIVRIVLYESLLINFIHKHWEQAINNSDESDPVGDYFKSKK